MWIIAAERAGVYVAQVAAKFLFSFDGTSPPAQVNLTVGSQAPGAATASLTVPLNGSGTIDLAPYISGSLITGVSVAVLPTHGLADVNGTKVTYTPRTDYFGTDTFTYIAYGNAGTSQPVVVLVTIEGRPDPSQDRTVVGIVDAQAQTARRFSRAQIGNFQRRLESLHAGAPAGLHAARDSRRASQGGERTARAARERRSLRASPLAHRARARLAHPTLAIHTQRHAGRIFSTQLGPNSRAGGQVWKNQSQERQRPT